MRFEEPEPCRIRFDQGLHDFRITIPARREWGSVLFIGFWLCCWAVGEAIVGFVIFKGLYGVLQRCLGSVRLWRIARAGAGLSKALARKGKLAIGRSGVVTWT